MTDTIPPLPQLDIDSLSKRMSDQQTVDQALQKLYERRPDFFTRLAERDKKQKNVRDIANEFRKFLREELNIVDSLVQPTVFSEARRRARLMYDVKLPDSVALKSLPRI